MVTALQPNSGGYISASFPANDLAKKNIIKIFTNSSKARAALASKHSQYVGSYGITNKPGKGIRITPILLPNIGIDDSGDTEVEVLVATLSNSASEGQAVIVQLEQFTGSTIRLVTHEFAKKPPKTWPKGKPFKSNCKKVDKIKVLLPDDSDTVQYVLVLCPNALGIPSGEPHTVKGSPDDSMAESFRELGDCGDPWFQIMTNLSAGAVAFNLDLQRLVETNKLEMDMYYPKHSAVITLTPSPAFTFSSPPCDEDDDDAISSTIAELRAQLADCVKRNAPPPPTALAHPPSNILTDMDSVVCMDTKPAASSATSTERYESKLRLVCASYSDDHGVILFDLKDEIKEIMALGKASQAEAFCNRLLATSNDLSDTMDAINRSADWPKSYQVTP